MKSTVSTDKRCFNNFLNPDYLFKAQNIFIKLQI